MTSEITDSRTPNVPRPGFGFWFQWIIANAAGLAIGHGGSAIHTRWFGPQPHCDWAAIGAAIGLIQMFNLKQYIERVNWLWVIPGTISWAIGWSMGWQLYSIIGVLSITQVFILQGGISGTLMGLAQWFLLRNQFRQAHWWLVANIVGWTVGMAIGRVGGAFGFILAGAVSGAITGFPLIWLIRNSVDKSSHHQTYAIQDEYLESQG